MKEKSSVSWRDKRWEVKLSDAGQRQLEKPGIQLLCMWSEELPDLEQQRQFTVDNREGQ